MNQQLKDVLVKVTRIFDKENITWGLGASGILFYHGIVDQVNDIDIVVLPDHVEQAEALVLTIGKKVDTPPSSFYDNEYFGEFIVDGVELDIMSNMTIINHGIKFLYEFTKASVVHYMKIQDVNVPISSLEEWYFLYHIIPNKDKKIKILDDYYKDHDFEFPEKLIPYKGLLDHFDDKIKEALCQIVLVESDSQI